MTVASERRVRCAHADRPKGAHGAPYLTTRAHKSAFFDPLTLFAPYRMQRPE